MHVVFLSLLYGLGVAFVLAALRLLRRVAEDKATVAQWYGLVCESLATAEKAADRAESAAGRATKATITQRANGSPVPADRHPDTPPAHPSGRVPNHP